MPVVASHGLCNWLGRELGGLGMYRLQPIGVCGVWGGGRSGKGRGSFACPLHLAAGEVVMVNSGGVPILLWCPWWEWRQPLQAWDCRTRAWQNS